MRPKRVMASATGAFGLLGVEEIGLEGQHALGVLSAGNLFHGRLEARLIPDDCANAESSVKEAAQYGFAGAGGCAGQQ